MKVITKICTTCNVSKELNCFYKFKNGKHGVESKCKDCKCKSAMEYHNANYESEKRHKYYKNNIVYFKAKSEEFRKNNPEYAKDYFTNNKDAINENRRNYTKNRRLNDPLYKLTHNIRVLIRHSFNNKGIIKNTKSEQILGCSFLQFREHLEKQFDEHMNWSNHCIYWETDHIVPVSLAKNEHELIELNHYTNFQPLEKNKNRKKSNNIKYV